MTLTKTVKRFMGIGATATKGDDQRSAASIAKAQRGYDWLVDYGKMSSELANSAEELANKIGKAWTTPNFNRDAFVREIETLVSKYPDKDVLEQDVKDAISDLYRKPFDELRWGWNYFFNPPALLYWLTALKVAISGSADFNDRNANWNFNNTLDAVKRQIKDSRAISKSVSQIEDRVRTGYGVIVG